MVPRQIVVRRGRVRGGRIEFRQRRSRAGGWLCVGERWEKSRAARAWETTRGRFEDALRHGPSILPSTGRDREMAERGRKLGGDRRGRGVERGGQGWRERRECLVLVPLDARDLTQLECGAWLCPHLDHR